MARLPIEDNFTDVIAKAQRGLKITDEQLAQRAEVSPEDLAALKSGEVLDPVIRRVARHLKLSASALEDLAHKRFYPVAPVFPRGFAMFNTPYGDDDLTVNNYLVWDARSRFAAVFDTGANADALIATIESLGLPLDVERKTTRAFNKLLWLQNDLITRHYQAA